MSGKYDDRLKDYVQVNERIIAFYEKYPEGALQSEITHLTDSLVVVKAWAYRNPGDLKPGVGHSSMIIPGSTPFTEGSEIENAETSAWGRALAALGFEVKRGVASRDEIDNKHVRNGAPANDPRSAALSALVAKARKLMGKDEGDAWLANRTGPQGLAVTKTTISLNQILALSEELSSFTQQDATGTEDDIDF